MAEAPTMMLERVPVREIMDEIRRLSEAVGMLRAYAGHDATCERRRGLLSCTCGWDVIGPRVDALLKEGTGG